jgi:hypothetical protein
MTLTTLSLWFILQLSLIVLETQQQDALFIGKTEPLPTVRLLQNVAETEHSFKVMFDFSRLDASVKDAKTQAENWISTETIDSQISFVKENFEKVKAYIEKYFTVKFKEEIKFSSTKCAGSRYIIGGQYLSKVDFYVDVRLENNENSQSPILAMNCLAEENTGRPVVGIMLVNMISVPKQRIHSRQLFRRFLHEFFHMLGYNSFIFQNFPGNEKGQSYLETKDVPIEVDDQSMKISYFNEKSVVQAARAYFSCPAASGLPLEYSSEFSAVGNHASFLQMPYSIMNGDPTIDPSIDPLTIQYLRSTGWYKISEQAVEAGRANELDPSLSISNEQCDVVNFACPASRNRCTLSQASSSNQQCSYNRLSKQICSVHSKFGKPTSDIECALWKNTQEYCREETTHSNFDKDVEEISTSSLCFMASQGSVDEESLIPRCLTYKCTENSSSNDASTITVTLKNGLQVVCNAAGYQVLQDIADPTRTVSIVCPNPADLCSSSSSEEIIKCGLDCTRDGLGLCMAHKKCFCFFGESEDTSTCKSYTPEGDKSTSMTKYSHSLSLPLTLVLAKTFFLIYVMT